MVPLQPYDTEAEVSSVIALYMKAAQRLVLQMWCSAVSSQAH